MKHSRSLSAKVLHWILAFSILSVLLIFEDGDFLHRYVGYLSFFTAILMLLRKSMDKKSLLISDHPYLALLVHGLIWALVLSLGITGWMMGLDAFWGDEWLERLHRAFSWSLVGLILFHLMGVFRDSYKYKRKTWMLMILGLNENQK